MNKRTLLGFAAAVIFLIGSGYIVYRGRPVMNMNPTNGSTDVATTPTPTDTVTTTPSTTPTPTTDPSPEPTPTPGTYTIAEVATHNTKTDCWTVINKNVYNLTDWVSRHPGGETPITRLCGTDGSSSFNKQHGKAARPASMLALFKIGVLR